MLENLGDETVLVSRKWVVEDVKDLIETKATRYCPGFAGGNWQIEICTNSKVKDSVEPQEHHCGLFVRCLAFNLVPRPQMKFKASVEKMQILRMDGKVLQERESFTHTFTDEANNWGYPKFAVWKELWDDDGTVRKDNKLAVVVEIREPLKKSTIEQCGSKISALQQANRHHQSNFDDPNTADIAFVFKEGTPFQRKLWCSKRFLSGSASYFAAMFNGGFAESELGPANYPLPSSPPSSPSSSSKRLGVSGGSTSSALGGSKSPWPNKEKEKEKEKKQENEKTKDPSKDKAKVKKDSVDEEAELMKDLDEVDSDDEELEPIWILKNKSMTLTTITPPPAVATEMAKLGNDTAPKGRHLTIPVIPIKDANYKTFRALLWYLGTGEIRFASLRSTERGKLLARKSEDPGPRYLPDNTPSSKEGDTGGWTPLPYRAGTRRCSPKSMFVLADMYNLDELKQLSLDGVKDNLTSNGVVFEIFSPIAEKYPAVMDVCVEYFLENWPQVRKSRAFEKIADYLGKAKPNQLRAWAKMMGSLAYVPPEKAETKKSQTETTES